MSLQLYFEPHSWYMDFAIKHNNQRGKNGFYDDCYRWQACTLNGMSGYIDELEANTLKDIKKQIKQYRTNEDERIHCLYGDVA